MTTPPGIAIVGPGAIGTTIRDVLVPLLAATSDGPG